MLLGLKNCQTKPFQSAMLSKNQIGATVNKQHENTSDVMQRKMHT